MNTEISSPPNPHDVSKPLHIPASIYRVSSPISRSDSHQTHEANPDILELRERNVARSSPRSRSSAEIRKSGRKAEIQFATLCLWIFLNGWNDGTNGPLLPTIQRFYGIGYTMVSLIFVSNCIGFISGAVLNIKLTDKLGFGMILVIGSATQMIAYAIQASAPPFPLFVISFAITGFGLALQNAQVNAFVVSYQKNANLRMSIMHAIYGAGALVAPLVATQFSAMSHWSFHYLCSLGLATVTTLALILVFRFKTQEECLSEIGQLPPNRENETAEQNSGKYKQILTIKSVHYLACFLLIYNGLETTIGGWIVTYIINLRHGGASAGYISSGFFGGLAIGRLALLWVTSKVGDKRVLYIYTVLAIGLELVVWLVPSLIGDAVAVSIVGLLLGPIYPIVMNVSGRILPPWLLTGAIGWIAGLGQAGSAAIPFVTGALASKSGIWTLQPLLVSLMGMLLVLWALIPNRPKRSD